MVHLSRSKMHLLLFACALTLMCVVGATAAEGDVVLQLQAPNGMTLWLKPATGEASTDGLQRVTVDTATQFVWPEREFTLLTVRNGKVESIKTQQTQPLAQELPQSPETEVIVGTVVGASFLARFKVGDPVIVREVPNNLPAIEPIMIITHGAGSKELDGINKSRGGGELIVYTPEFGTHTHTNEFGFEAIAVNNKVVAHRQYGDKQTTEIPENGVVISGQGANGTWVKENFPIGMEFDLL